jgi:hypothetical protein
VTASPAPDFPGPQVVDGIAAAVSRCRSVVRLDPGGWRPVATYLPGRRVTGVRVDDESILVSIVLALGISVPAMEAEVRAAVAPYAGGRRVDLHVADVQAPDPHPASLTPGMVVAPGEVK